MNIINSLMPILYKIFLLYNNINIFDINKFSKLPPSIIKKLITIYGYVKITHKELKSHSLK